ncbi:MAG: hypothetical protein WBA89_19650 [Microcoleus sp.]
MPSDSLGAIAFFCCVRSPLNRSVNLKLMPIKVRFIDRTWMGCDRTV